MAADPQPVLAEFAAALSATPSSFDEATLDHAAILLLDHQALVAAAGGVDAAAAAAARDAASAPVDERCAVHAELGAAADRDDVSWLRLVHPGSIVWPTVLGLGEASGRSGAEVLRAAVIGYDTTARLAAILPPGASGHHLTALTATVGAAAAASAILADDGAVDAAALGHAISVGGGSTGAFRELSGTRRFHRGQAVRSGIAAARAARRGLTATRFDLEHGGGAWAGADVAALDLSVPDGWGLRTTSVRVFPTSGWNQTVFEAARAAATGLTGPILAIHARAPETAIARSVPLDRAGADPWNSVHSAVAAGALAGSTGGRPDPGALSELRALVVVEPGPVAEVRVVTADGEQAAAVALPSGHPDRPAQLADLAAAWGVPLPVAESRLAALRAYLSAAERDRGRNPAPS